MRFEDLASGSIGTDGSAPRSQGRRGVGRGHRGGAGVPHTRIRSLCRKSEEMFSGKMVNFGNNLNRPGTVTANLSIFLDRLLELLRSHELGQE